MEYFNLLEFYKEPFSNSPEPEFLFESPQHGSCLQRLELAVRLRRGLNIVIGDVGTGKTTLCRKLIQSLAVNGATDAPEMETFLLLDPETDGRLAFLRAVASVLKISDLKAKDLEWQIKEKIKNFLFEKGVQENKNVVLIIDEGQKIQDDCLEILREFLNYETNSFKLLQIVIFAQPEFRKSLAARPNLLDRINFLYHLKPLTFQQTKAMIEHRIALSSIDPERPPLFTFAGILAVYRATGGYPRRIVSLCHQALIMMIIRGRRKADWFLIRRDLEVSERTESPKALRIALVSILMAGVVVLGALYWNHWGSYIDQGKINTFISGIDLKNIVLPSKFTAKAMQKNDVLDGNFPKTEVSEEVVIRIPEETVPVEKDLPPAVPEVKVASLPNPPLPPELLGEVALKKKMTIWLLLENVYGDTGSATTEKFVASNPHLKNIDNTYPGMRICVPSISERVRSVKQDTILLCLEDGSNFQSIYYSYIQKKDLDAEVPLKFLPIWNPREGLRFMIVLDRQFTSLEQAEEALRRLPERRAVYSRILSKWDADTVAFNGSFIP